MSDEEILEIEPEETEEEIDAAIDAAAEAEAVEMMNDALYANLDAEDEDADEDDDSEALEDESALADEPDPEERRPKDINGKPYYLGDKFQIVDALNPRTFEVIGLGEERVFYQPSETEPLTFAWSNQTIHVLEPEPVDPTVDELLARIKQAVSDGDIELYARLMEELQQRIRIGE